MDANHAIKGRRRGSVRHWTFFTWTPLPICSLDSSKPGLSPRSPDDPKATQVAVHALPLRSHRGWGGWRLLWTALHLYRVTPSLGGAPDVQRHRCRDRLATDTWRWVA